MSLRNVIRALLFLLGLLLMLVGLLAGGCSLFFTPSLFQTGEFAGMGNFPIWASGLVIAFLGIGLGILIFRRLKRPDAAPTTAPTTPPRASEASEEDAP